MKFKNFIKIKKQRFASQNEKLKQLAETDKAEQSDQPTDLFTDYITNILKRGANMPIVRSKLENDLSQTEINEFIKNTINLVKYEYIEKQKK